MVKLSEMLLHPKYTFVIVFVVLHLAQEPVSFYYDQGFFKEENVLGSHTYALNVDYCNFICMFGLYLINVIVMTI